LIGSGIPGSRRSALFLWFFGQLPARGIHEISFRSRRGTAASQMPVTHT
jgi:hypothetical protein